MDVYALDFSKEANNPVAKIKNLSSILNIIIPIMTVGAALIFITMLIVGSFGYLTSGGNPESVKKAQGTLFSAILGLFLVICAYLIVKLMSGFFNITLPI